MHALNYFPAEIKLKVQRDREHPHKRYVSWNTEIYGNKHSDGICVRDDRAEICGALCQMAEQASAYVSMVLKYEEEESDNR